MNAIVVLDELHRPFLFGNLAKVNNLLLFLAWSNEQMLRSISLHSLLNKPNSRDKK